LTEHKFKPFVPANTDMKEFTIRSLIIGLIMAVVLGAANAYLGLKAGMTIAATYPAAVIGMAILVNRLPLVQFSRFRHFISLESGRILPLYRII